MTHKDYDMILMASSLALITLTLVTLYLLELPQPKDGLTIAVFLFLPCVAVRRMLRGDVA